MLIDFLNSYFKSSLWGIKISSCIMDVSSQNSLLQTFVSYLLYICRMFLPISCFTRCHRWDIATYYFSSNSTHLFKLHSRQ